MKERMVNNLTHAGKVHARKKGVALVVVLSCMLLICGLVLSFFLSVSTETKASKIADDGNRSRDLVDTSVNVIMAQIRQATTQGSDIAWSSQPGMIRTFTNSPLRNFKLYSSPQMVVEASAYSPATEIESDWSSKKAIYTDLNQPAKSISGVNEYPIVDPSSIGLASQPKGFAINAAPLATTNPAGVAANAAPMPVQWLYVLRDGSIIASTGGEPAAENGTGATASFTGSATPPSKDNPIVGRIAFWTDDDSSKININTAAGDEWVESSTTSSLAGSYWDTPHLYTTFDKNSLALSQPAQYEYQRYPGHPATTYLSAVFPTFTREQIGNIATRVQTGGSQGGTVNFLSTEKVALDSNRLYSSIDELLYNPLREEQSGISKTQLNQTRFFLTAHSRAPEITLFGTPRVSMWPVHRSSNTESLKRRTPFDDLIAFCSQLRVGNTGYDYFFVRNNANSPTSDMAVTRNNRLLTYLKNLTEKPIPGYGGNFLDKYQSDRDQILTQIFDYIRSTNLFDDSLEPLPYAYPTKGQQFTAGRSSATGSVAGHGQVAPAYDAATNTMGFGRFDTISEVGLQFICNADGSGKKKENGDPLTTLDGIKIQSNKPELNRTLKAGVPLEDGQKRIEVMFLTELFSVAHGWTALGRNMQIEVTGLNTLAVRGAEDATGYVQNLGFPAVARMHITQTSQGTIHGRGWGGMGGHRTHMRGRGIPARVGPDGHTMAADRNVRTSGNLGNIYPFVSAPVTVKTGATNTIQLLGAGDITIKIYAGGTTTSNAPESQLVQTIRVNFTNHNGVDGIFPAPDLVIDGTPNYYSTGADYTWMHTSSTETLKEHWWTFSRDGIAPEAAPDEQRVGRLLWVGEEPGRNDFTNTNRGTGEASGCIIRGLDTVRTLVPKHGDYRLVAANKIVNNDVFVPHQYYATLGQRLAHSMTEVLGAHYIYGATMTGRLTDTGSVGYANDRRPDVPFRDSGATANVAAGEPKGAWGSDSGDWDTGIGHVSDGSYINKPDEGSAYDGDAASVPYFSYTERHQTAGPTFFSPNRQVMSPVMFGSLPSQVKKNIPWRTLLFRPDPTGQDSSNAGFTHVGGLSPKDHLLLDLFWMPVVEPYAISESFSTAGKINMNYQIVPFTYIDRSTGMRALLKSERVTAIKFDQGKNYKSNKDINYRLEIDADETLKQFTEKFANGTNVFRSATEICELYLVPKGVTYSNTSTMKNYWHEHRLTGDNMKERPYASLYPRLTTKSNTFTVHYKVQALQQAVRSRGDTPAAWQVWNESLDQVVSETRGSTTLERYVDAEDPQIIDYATANITSDLVTLDQLYRFRIINSKRFAP